MGDSIVLIVLLVVGIPLAAVIWLVARAVETQRRLDHLSDRLTRLEGELSRSKLAAAPQVATPEPEIIRPPPPVSQPKPVPAQPVPPPVPAPAPTPARPPVFTRPHLPEPSPFQPKPVSTFDWEQFMGVKLFAWLGGLALFLGVVFFVKYSFDNNLISPAWRVTLGFLAGLGLLAGGIVLSRKNYPALSQSVCATGVVVLYAVTFACHAYYHFPAFGLGTTFLIMGLVTAVAFVLAVRLNALVVAILGMLGGFLAPILLSTGVDSPFALFGYLAILDAGLILVALRRRWDFLTALAALATALMQTGWADRFFVAEGYTTGTKIFTALGILLTFQVLYLAANGWARRRDRINDWLSGSALGLAASALFFSAWFLTFPSLAARPALMFSFVFIVDSGVAILALLNPKLNQAQPIAGLAVFGLLGFWTANSLNAGLLDTALVMYFVFALWHAAFPLFLQRRFGLQGPIWGGHVFPAAALLLVLFPIFRFDDASLAVWALVLVLDLVAIAFSLLLRSAISVLAALILSLVANGVMIFKIPASLAGLPISFCLLGIFAVLFVMAGLWLGRKSEAEAKNEADTAS